MVVVAVADIVDDIVDDVAVVVERRGTTDSTLVAVMILEPIQC